MSSEFKRAQEAYEAKQGRDRQAEIDRLHEFRKKHETLFARIYGKIEQAATQGKKELFWKRPKNLKVSLHDLRDFLKYDGFDVDVNFSQPTVATKLRISGWAK